MRKADTPLTSASPTRALASGRPLDRLAYLIATGFGAGLLPKAPGTFGAIEGVALFIAFEWFSAGIRGNHILIFVIYSAVNVLVFAVGTAAAGRVCRMLQLEDPQIVVIDEVSGQMIALAPALLAPGALMIITAFILFRLFDIVKPYPIRKLEHLPGGFGVMLDDVLAGIYAAAMLSAGHVIHLF